MSGVVNVAFYIGGGECRGWWMSRWWMLHNPCYQFTMTLFITQFAKIFLFHSKPNIASLSASCRIWIEHLFDYVEQQEALKWSSGDHLDRQRLSQLSLNLVWTWFHNTRSTSSSKSKKVLDVTSKSWFWDSIYWYMAFCSWYHSEQTMYDTCVSLYYTCRSYKALTKLVVLAQCTGPQFVQTRFDGLHQPKKGGTKCWLIF